MMPRRVVPHRDASPLARCQNPDCRAPMVLMYTLGLLVTRCQHCGRSEEVHDVEDEGSSWFHWNNTDDE